MGVGNGKQEIARCRDRLLLSGSWLLSYSNISGAQARREMTKYNGFLCTFSSVLDSGPDTGSAWETGNKHGCLWEDESLADLHTGKWHACTHQGFSTRLHLLSFFRGRKSIKLGAFDLHPQGLKLARMAFPLWQHAMWPWKKLHWEWKAEVSVSIDKGSCENWFHYVPRVQAALPEFCWYLLWFIAIQF